MVSAMAVGSIAGALVNGAHGRTGPRLIAGGALAFGVSGLLAAAMPSLAFEIPMLALLGAAAVTFAATINSTLQLAVAPKMRGRVMALYSVVFLGSTPIGGPLTGWLAETYDPRVALLLAGITGLSAAWAAHVSFARMRSRAATRAPLSCASLAPTCISHGGGPTGGARRTLPAFVRRAPPAGPPTASRCSRRTSGRPRPLPSASAFRVRPERRAPA